MSPLRQRPTSGEAASAERPSPRPPRQRVHIRWWSKTRGLDRDRYDSLVVSLAAQPHRPTRILSWAPTATGVCVGTPAALSFDDAAGGWTHIGWQEIEKGGWNSETNSLQWALYGGRRGSVALVEPGLMPGLFRERVAASIVLERLVPVQGTRGIIVSGRRDLGNASAPLAWHASLSRGMTWQTPGAREVADAALAQVQAEYDIG